MNKSSNTEADLINIHNFIDDEERPVDLTVCWWCVHESL